ncbi:MAG: MBL fold metallo-hydrolase [archaeon]|nr:MAG: MBL fold metallo-hydrolase [archaeon]
MKLGDVELEWLGHASFRIKTKGKTIYIDPYQLTNPGKANVILLTHSHYDHCSLTDLEKITRDGTTIICTPDSQSTATRIDLKIDLRVIESGQEIQLDGIKIKAIPAYNLNKKFHPKTEHYVGFVIRIKNTVIYHAGDTDVIKEMQELTGYGKKGNTFIALLPVGGTYTMTAEEAAKAASLIKPTIAIPMHYASIVGSSQDAKSFSELCKKQGINVKILEKSS